MSKTRIDLKSLGADETTFTVDDPAVWLRPIQECGMTCRVIRPIIGEVTLLPQESGCLTQGHLCGEVVVPCDRCAEDAHIEIDYSFSSFEPFPQNNSEEDFDRDAEVMRLSKDGGVEIDIGSLLWEEFVLSLPIKPLCKADCRGLCPTCGKNLNEGSCSCLQEQGDPRLALLRGLKVNKPAGGTKL